MTLPEPAPFSTLLLAAGESRRMGVQKQLLLIHGKPMVRRAAELARAVSSGPVIVVVGAGAEAVTAALAGLDVNCVVNTAWREGMGASLRTGMQALARVAPDVAAVLVLLADQPGVSAARLDALLEKRRHFPDRIIASEHEGIAQPPALFPRAWFGRLAALGGDRGARVILREAAGEVQLVALASPGDIDTPEDYDAFVRTGGT